MWKDVKSRVKQKTIINQLKTKSSKKLPTFEEFLQNTSFHGVRHVFDKDPSPFGIRRILWLFLVIGAVVLFALQVKNRIETYLLYQTTVDVRIMYPDEMQFPAVTICNQNNFRISSAYDLGLYNFIDDVFSSKNYNYSMINMTEYPIENFKTEDFLFIVGHQKGLLIDQCYWHGRPCNYTDIQITLTDMGICFTFNSGKYLEPLIVTEPGELQGLSLIINVEQYEYMSGPQSDAGVKILLHGQNELPLMKDQGFSVAPGTHTFINIQTYKLISMPEPYGDCKSQKDYTFSKCITECRAQMLIESCGCRDLYMPNITNVEPCNMTQSFSCVLRNSAEIQKAEMKCKCSTPCQHTRYAPSMSYAQLSKFNVDRLVLNEPERKVRLEEDLFKSREVSQRAIEHIYIEDQYQMREILQTSENIHVILLNNTQLKSFNDYAMYYDAADIVSEVDDLPENATSFAKAIYRDHENGIINTMYRTAQGKAWNTDLTFQVMSKFRWTLGDFLRWDYSKRISLLLNDLEKCAVETCWFKNAMISAIIYNSRRTLSSTREQVLNELASFKNGYGQKMKLLFDPSDRKPDDLLEHLKCLSSIDELEFGIVASILQISNLLYQVTTVVDYDKYVTVTREIVNVFNSTKLAVWQVFTEIYDDCQWPYHSLINENWKYNLWYSRHHRAFVYHEQMKVAAGYVTQAYNKVFSHYERKVFPLMKFFKLYLLMNETKLQVSKRFEKTLVKKAIVDFADLALELTTAVEQYEVITSLVGSLLRKAFGYITNITVPIIHHDNYRNIFWIKAIYYYNNSQCEWLLETWPGGTGQTLDEVTRIQFELYTEPINAIVSEFANQSGDFNARLEKIQVQLDKYLEDSNMDADFYMENFLQVDIFHRELSYELIAQQPAFGLLSLLSEVGGFLGLLLGASVLTMLEIFDYAMLFCMKRCSDHADSTSKDGETEDAVQISSNEDTAAVSVPHGKSESQSALVTTGHA